MSGPPPLPPRGYGKFPAGNSPRPSRPPPVHRPLPAHDTSQPTILPSTSKPLRLPVTKPSYDMSRIFWTERVAKLPIIDTKIYTDEKCNINYNFISNRQPESLNDLRKANKSFDGFCKDFIEVNDKYRTYSQAKKIQLLLLYYIKKYNSKDVAHARDCYNYIITLNDQKKWLSPSDLNFINIFAFNNKVFVITNKLINEELDTSLTNEDPLMYGYNHCNNKILLWLLHNVLINVNIKQFKYVNDIIINKKKCFTEEVIDSYKFLYTQIDDAFYKSIDLAILQDDMNQFVKIVKEFSNNNSYILDKINYYIFNNHSVKAIPFSREIFRIYTKDDPSVWVKKNMIEIVNKIVDDGDNIPNDFKKILYQFIEFFIGIIINYQPDFITNFLVPKITEFNDSQRHAVKYWIPRVQMIIDILVKFHQTYIIKNLLPKLIEKIIQESSTIIRYHNNTNMPYVKVNLNKADYYWVEYIIDKTRFTKDQYDTLIKESTSKLNINNDNPVTQYIKLLINRKFNS